MSPPPLIPYLANVKRWIWLAYLVAFMLFIAIIAILDAASPPGTPANQLVAGSKGWLFLLPAAIGGYGFYLSARYWRCPRCKGFLPTKNYQRIPVRCTRCGAALRA